MENQITYTVDDAYQDFITMCAKIIIIEEERSKNEINQSTESN